MHKFNAKSGKTLAIGAVLGLGAGALTYLIQPIQWDATALVGVGQILSVKRDGPPALIEELLTVEERVKSPSFAAAALARMKSGTSNGISQDEYDEELSAKPIRNTNTLLISFVGKSPEIANAALHSVVDELLAKHALLFNQTQADAQAEIANLNLEIESLSKKIATSPNGRSDVSGNLSLDLWRHELDDDIHRAGVLRDSVSSMNMRPTSLLEPISVTERRMIKSPWRACLFGAIAGVAASLILIRQFAKN
jgi:hypothetical protein